MPDLEIDYLGQKYLLKIEYRKQKNIVIHFPDANVLKITAPLHTSVKKIIGVLNQNEKRIEKKALASKKDASHLHLFGKSYELEFNQGTFNDVVLDEENKHVLVIGKDETKIEKYLLSFRARLFQKYLEENYLAICKSAAIVKVPLVKVRMTKAQFGSYSKRTHTISLALQLTRYEPKYIASVIVHELAHIKVLNHQKAFYAEMERIMPGSVDLQKAMKKI